MYLGNILLNLLNLCLGNLIENKVTFPQFFSKGWINTGKKKKLEIFKDQGNTSLLTDFIVK